MTRGNAEISTSDMPHTNTRERFHQRKGVGASCYRRSRFLGF